MSDLARYHPIKVFLTVWPCGMVSRGLLEGLLEGRRGMGLLLASVTGGWGLALGLTLACLWAREQAKKKSDQG